MQYKDDYKIIKYISNKSHQKQYLCQCMKCGHVKNISLQNIKKQSLNCSYRNCKRDYLSNLIGVSIEDYTFVSVTDDNKIIAICNKCSNHKIIKTCNLKTISFKHSASSCSDNYYNNEIGNIYGDFKIINILGKIHKNIPEVYCEAKCLKCNITVVKKLSSIQKLIYHGVECIKSLEDSEIKKVVIERFNDMQQRCNNPNNDNYSHYGGRGIKLLYNSSIELYNDFKDELKHHAKQFGLSNSTFDRIDVNGNYEKSNLRIATRSIQNVNKRNKRLFIIKRNDDIVISDSAMEVGRVYKINGRAIGNLIRGNSKSSFGFKLIGVYNPDINIKELIRKENVTTNLIMS